MTDAEDLLKQMLIFADGACTLFRLDEDNQPHPCTVDEYIEWRRLLPQDPGMTQLGLTTAWSEVGDAHVSTAFLAHNMSPFRDGAPLLWETMCFASDRYRTPLDYQERYTSHADALEGHARAVAWLRGQGRH